MNLNLSMLNKKNWIWLTGAVILLLMAWRSEGFYHPDEHYQLLEFANYKSGLALNEGLAWEFHHQIRPGFQPLLAFAAMSLFRFLQVENPFIIAFFLRLISGLLSLIVLIQIGKYLLKETQSIAAYRTFLGLSLFLWFCPFLHVRFSSENWAAFTFFGGTLILLDCLTNSEKKHIFYLALSGLLISLSFQCRYQMGFAIAGLAAWLLMNKKFDWAEWLYFICGGLIGLSVGLFSDYWLYDDWQLTPYKYFVSNIVEGRAAGFGTQPWWYYFTELFDTTGPILNVTLLVLFFYGAYSGKMHPFIWIMATFLFGHLVVGHKELRFLFPMLIPFLYLVSLGWFNLIPKIKSKIYFKGAFVLICSINMVLLWYRLSESAYIKMPYFRYLYTQAKTAGEVLIFFYENPANPSGQSGYGSSNNIYGPNSLRMTFYRPKNIKQIPISSSEQLDKFDISGRKTFLFSNRYNIQTLRLKTQKLTFVYQAWIISKWKNFNIFKKTDLDWKIYRVYD